MIKVHLAEGGAPERRTRSLEGEKRSSGLQPGDRIPCFPLVRRPRGGVQIITQIVHTRSTIHHRITVLSKVFRCVRTGVQLVFHVTYITTAPVVLPARSRGPPRVGARLPARVFARLTVTLVTDTVTSADRLRLMLLRVLVARPVAAALAVRVTSTGRTTVAATASLTRYLRRNSSCW